TRTGAAGAGRARDEPAPRRGAGVDLAAGPAGQDALRRLPPPGVADHQEPDGVGGDAGQPAGQGDREVLGGSRGPSAAAAAGEPAQGRPAAAGVLAAPARSSHGAMPLPERGGITNRVVRPATSGKSTAGAKDRGRT